MTLDDFLPSTSCQGWRQPQNATFHFSMVAFFAASLIPYTNKFYNVSVKGLYIVASVFMLLWGYLYWCTQDIVVWSIIYIIQNFSMFIHTCYSYRTVKLSPDLEEIYRELFVPFNISRPEFKALVNQNCKFVNISPGDKYAVEGHTTTDPRVSILISGSLNVTFKGIHLHQINEKQIIDSPEWHTTKIKRGEIFQVTIEADDPCYYMCWNRERLQYYLEANPKLEKAMQLIRGRDVLNKVMSTTKNAIKRSGNRNCNITMTNIRNGLVDEDPSSIYK